MQEYKRVLEVVLKRLSKMLVLSCDGLATYSRITERLPACFNENIDTKVQLLKDRNYNVVLNGSGVAKYIHREINCSCKKVKKIFQNFPGLLHIKILISVCSSDPRLCTIPVFHYCIEQLKRNKNLQKPSRWGTSLPFSPDYSFFTCSLFTKNLTKRTFILTVIFVYTVVYVLTGGYRKKLLGYLLLLVCFGSSFIDLWNKLETPI